MDRTRDSISERPQLDWELLNEPIMADVQDGGALGDGWTNVTVSRTPDLDLTLDLVGRGYRPHKKPLPAGSFEKAEDISPAKISVGGYQGELRMPAVTSWGATPKGQAHEIAITYSHKPVVWQTYWLVNVEKRHWPSGTERDGRVETTRNRPGLPPRKSSSGERSGSSDHVLIDCAGLRFAFGSVSAGLASREIRAGFLEVVAVDGQLPTQDTIFGVLEFLRFIMGTEINCIGRTDYDAEDLMVERVSHSRWLQVGHFQDSPWAAPCVPIESLPSENALKRTVEALLPVYLAGRIEKNFSMALWHHAIGRRLPVSSNVTAFSAAFDLLVNGFVPPGSAPSLFISAEDFRTRTDEVRKALAEALRGVPDAVKMLNKFDSSINAIGDSGRRERLFSSLDMQLSSAEIKALKFRNPAVHGHRIDIDWLAAHGHGEVIEQLLLRVLLRLLCYEGEYIDYATPGRPPRRVFDPCRPDTDPPATP